MSAPAAEAPATRDVPSDRAAGPEAYSNRTSAAVLAAAAGAGGATGAARRDALVAQRSSIGNRATSALLRGAQPKLTVGAADDSLEHEADDVARRVVAALAEKEDPEAGVVARKIQRRGGVGREGGPVDEVTASTIEAERGRGRPMDAGARRSMESAFGADFGQVRLHSGPTSAALNDTLSASAFTIGSDIFFQSSIPDARTSSGQELLAHELTHVVQQGAAPVARTIRRRARSGRYLEPKANPRVDGAGRRPPAPVEEENEEVVPAKGGRAKAETRRRRKQVDNTNYRGGIPGRGAYAVKAVFSSLPDVAVNRLSPAGPNAVSHIDADDYGICDTETISDGDLKLTAVKDAGAWHLEAIKVAARYSKIIQLPAGVTEITGPGGGGAGQTTVANSEEQIKCLLATFGPPWYLLSAVDGHESVHEQRLLPALRNIAPQIQTELANLTVPHESDPLALGAESLRPGGPTKFGDKASALVALKALPGYAAALATIMTLWDNEYDRLIADDHQGKAQRGEEKASRPMIAKINKFRKQNGEKAIKVKYTWTPY